MGNIRKIVGSEERTLATISGFIVSIFLEHSGCFQFVPFKLG
jgi:hypothetical protein